MAETLREQHESALDTAEQALFDAIKAGQSWAIIFYLKHSREGRSRGYSERVEVATQPAVNIVVNISRVPAREPEPDIPLERTPEYHRLIRDLVW